MSNYEDSLKALQESYLKAIRPLLNSFDVSPIIKTFQNSISTQTEFTSQISKQLASALPDMSLELSSAFKELCSSLSKSQTTALKNALDASNLASSLAFSGKATIKHPDTSKPLSENDFVILDEAPVKELELPDNIAIPIRNYKVKIKTSDFIAILSLIITIALSFLPSDSEKQIQTVTEILQSMDTSLSTEAELIDDLKESFQRTVQEYHSVPSDLSDLKQDVSEISQSVDSIQESPDTLIEPEHGDSTE